MPDSVPVSQIDIIHGNNQLFIIITDQLQIAELPLYHSVAWKKIGNLNVFAFTTFLSNKMNGFSRTRAKPWTRSRSSDFSQVRFCRNVPRLCLWYAADANPLFPLIFRVVPQRSEERARLHGRAASYACDQPPAFAWESQCFQVYLND